VPDAAALCDRLTRGEVVALELPDWEALLPAFERLESHDTQVSGELTLLRGLCDGVLAVECPRPAERTVRLLASLEAAQAFVAQRLATYERMWNGCGCRVDLYR
jgi:hypothetical protein